MIRALLALLLLAFTSCVTNDYSLLQFYMPVSTAAFGPCFVGQVKGLICPGDKLTVSEHDPGVTLWVQIDMPNGRWRWTLETMQVSETEAYVSVLQYQTSNLYWRAEIEPALRRCAGDVPRREPKNTWPGPPQVLSPYHGPQKLTTQQKP